MALMDNMVLLLKNLRDNGWHITAFPFSFKNIDYIVLFEDIDNLKLVANGNIVRLTFIDTTDADHVLEVKANPNRFDIGAKQLREFFGIEYSENLGDIFRQFYERFGAIIPRIRPLTLSTAEKNAAIQRLNRNDNDNDNAMCCYAARRNGVYDGKQHYRTPFNSDKTKLLRETLYERLGGDDTISFCYREENELDDITIINQFMINYGED